MRCLARQKSAAPRWPDKFSVAHHYGSAQRNDCRATADFESLESIVVDSRVLSCMGKPASKLRIVDHQIGITAWLNGTLAWKQAEELCGIGAGHGHELVQIQASLSDAMGIEQIHPFFE